jgi:hypothetical protein
MPYRFVTGLEVYSDSLEEAVEGLGQVGVRICVYICICICICIILLVLLLLSYIVAGRCHMSYVIIIGVFSMYM